MQGLNAKDLKRHPSLIPLYVCVGFGGLMAVFYTIRLFAKNPDYSWNTKSAGSSNQEYANKQYKFYSPSGEFHPSPAPKY